MRIGGHENMWLRQTEARLLDDVNKPDHLLLLPVLLANVQVNLADPSLAAPLADHLAHHLEGRPVCQVVEELSDGPLLGARPSHHTPVQWGTMAVVWLLEISSSSLFQ